MRFVEPSSFRGSPAWCLAALACSPATEGAALDWEFDVGGAGADPSAVADLDGDGDVDRHDWRLSLPGGERELEFEPYFDIPEESWGGRWFLPFGDAICLSDESRDDDSLHCLDVDGSIEESYVRMRLDGAASIDDQGYVLDDGVVEALESGEESYGGHWVGLGGGEGWAVDEELAVWSLGNGFGTAQRYASTDDSARSWLDADLEARVGVMVEGSDYWMSVSPSGSEERWLVRFDQGGRAQTAYVQDYPGTGENVSFCGLALIDGDIVFSDGRGLALRRVTAR